MAAHQAPPSLGFSRQEHWNGLPLPSPVMKVKSESEVTQSCPTLCDPMDCSLPGSSAPGIFQARVLEWVAIAFSATIGYSRTYIFVFIIEFTGNSKTGWKTVIELKAESESMTAREKLIHLQVSYGFNSRGGPGGCCAQKLWPWPCPKQRKAMTVILFINEFLLSLPVQIFLHFLYFKNRIL